MKYELCKELRDAGFPQHGLPYFCDVCKKDQYNDEGIDSCDCFYDAETMNVDVQAMWDAQTCIPNLSELIKECGTDFSSLQRKMKNWYAVASNFVGVADAAGETPEEAVAKLWLVLNEKDTNTPTNT